jgi:rare lipoprotein A
MKYYISVIAALLILAVPTHASWTSRTTDSSKKCSESKASGFHQKGVASWYGAADSHYTANGEIYNCQKMTAAHKTLPFNSKVVVRNLANNKEVMVRINDRGPFVHGRIIDLSTMAAQELGLKAKGLAPVEIRVVQ